VCLEHLDDDEPLTRTPIEYGEAALPSLAPTLSKFDADAVRGLLHTAQWERLHKSIVV